MARGVRRVARKTWIYDSEALSQLLAQDPRAMARLSVARANRTAVKVSAMTVPEACHGKVRREWLRYVLSRLTVEPVTEQLAVRASELLHEHDLHGHRHAIDAVVAATALSCAPPAAVLTSDPGDMTRLCTDDGRASGDRVEIVRV